MIMDFNQAFNLAISEDLRTNKEKGEALLNFYENRDLKSQLTLDRIIRHMTNKKLERILKEKENDSEENIMQYIIDLTNEHYEEFNTATGAILMDYYMLEKDVEILNDIMKILCNKSFNDLKIKMGV